MNAHMEYKNQSIFLGSRIKHKHDNFSSHKFKINLLLFETHSNWLLSADNVPQHDENFDLLA